MGMNIKIISLILLTLLFSGEIMAEYKIENVSFLSKGKKLVGKLLIPSEKPKGAFTILGPVAFAKEQSPIQYASRLAKEGYIALIFDPRSYGESEGEPRRFENRKWKVEDVQSSVDYLLTRKEISPDKIFALGICQGVNWTLEASTLDKRIKKVVLVASHLLTPETAHRYVGGEEGVKNKLNQARLSKEKFEETGKVDYIPIVREFDLDSTALLFPKPIAEWYLPWNNRAPYFGFRGSWENKITHMSELDIWGHDVTPIVKQLQSPILMIHSDNAATGPDIPKKIFELIPSKEKKLVWFEEKQFQFQFYEECITIDKVVWEIVNWLK